MGDCYKAGDGNNIREDYVEISPEGIIPSLDENGYLWLGSDNLVGCYECKNARKLTMTIMTSPTSRIFLVTCGICGRDVAKTEGIE